MRIGPLKCGRWVLFSALSLILMACATGQRLPDFTGVLANPERPAQERALDEARKPDEVLKFYGVKAGDRVADIWAGRGYYTAILAQVVGPQGVVYSANPKPRPKLPSAGKSPALPTSG